MYRIAICDDEKLVRDSIHTMLDRYSAESGREFSIIEYESAVLLLREYRADFDLLFLDISMQGLDGMSAARELRKSDERVRIIFVTSMQQYAIEGYKVRAFGFVTKPMNYQELCLELDGALRSIDAERLRENAITLKSGMSVDRLAVADILYCEVLNHTVVVHTHAGAKGYRTQMREMEELLGQYGFFRVHSAYLVNHAAIAQVLGDKLILTSGEEIPLSRHKRKEFLSALARYVGGQA